MSGRVDIAKRGVAWVSGGFLAVLVLALSLTVAVTTVAPSSPEGASLVATGAVLGGTKLPDPQTRARNAWASALASSSRWRTVSSAWSAALGMTGLADATPWLGGGARRPAAQPSASGRPSSLPSVVYASQAPPLPTL